MLMPSRTRFAPLLLMRIPTALVLCSLVAGGLWAFGETRAAAGVAIGWALYTINAWMLYEIGRAFLCARSAGAANLLASMSTVGRLAMLFVALIFVHLGLGRSATLGACGGVLLPLLNLHVPRTRLKEVAR
jgi:hypothetical protein